MSISKWAYDPKRCDGDYCPQDCDYCDKARNGFEVDDGMDDLISRRAAIDAVCMEWCGVKHQDCKHPFDVEKDDDYWCDGCETALLTLSDLPSAEPKTGEWVWSKDNASWCCGTCGCVFEEIEWKPEYNFCPNCGADMRTKETDYDYERAIDQLEHDILYEPTFNQDDGSM